MRAVAGLGVRCRLRRWRTRGGKTGFGWDTWSSGARGAGNPCTWLGMDGYLRGGDWSQAGPVVPLGLRLNLRGRTTFA